MKTLSILLIPLIVMCVAGAETPSIIFDNRPEAGVPLEASFQEPESDDEGDVRLFHEMTDGAIKTVRIRYFNKESWATEEMAKKYLSGFLAHESQQVSDQQVSAKLVPSVPEIECIVEFTPEHHLAKLKPGERRRHHEGRLLIWYSEACYRDATGRWFFVSTFDHFDRSHPKGRVLAKEPIQKAGEQDGARQPATSVDSKAQGNENTKPESEAGSR